MGLKCDRWIRQMAKEAEMIVPFAEGQIRAGTISYGLSSYGYDMRLSREFKILGSPAPSLLDPKAVEEGRFLDHVGDFCVIPPHSFVLARSLEYFRIPRSVLTLCLGKSTYARCGIIVNVTPFEPAWEGYATLEISNTGPCPAKLYAEEGIAQILFFEADSPCETSYAEKKGRYQAQKGITLPKL
ncbi:MAG: dCTP deaminase [candidate division NC10 bacterium]|nr:dCTP deaminase [candidate division NC10 bacterium]